MELIHNLRYPIFLYNHQKDLIKVSLFCEGGIHPKNRLYIIQLYFIFTIHFFVDKLSEILMVNNIHYIFQVSIFYDNAQNIENPIKKNTMGFNFMLY